MKDKTRDKAFEELSAYLDGEADSPGEVKDRIEGDPDAAKLAEDLAVLSREMGRLPAPDVHPAFRTRVMAHVRETPPESAQPRLSWPWRALAAMVVLAPVAALFYAAFLMSPDPLQTNGDRALVQYLLNHDEDEILHRLSELYTDEFDDEWFGESSWGAMDPVDESVWLDVLAMDPAFAEWAATVESTDERLWDVDSLLDDAIRGDTTI